MADGRETITIPPGADYICPECNTHLSAAPRPPVDRRWIIAFAAVFLTVAGFLFWWLTRPQPKPFEGGVNSIGMRFVAIPSTGMYWSVWETRVADFSAFVKENPAREPGEMVSLLGGDGQETENFWRSNGNTWRHPEFEQTDQHPVVGVSFDDGRAFCDWLNIRERAFLHKFHIRYRLPTEDEWRVAAGYDGTYSWGDDWQGLIRSEKPIGNFAGVELKEDKTWPQQFKTIASYADGWKRTAPVGTYPPNRFGLYDMDGNVSEWCVNTSTPSSAVVCGGSWCSREPDELELTAREELPFNTRNSRIGFRVIAAPENTPP